MPCRARAGRTYVLTWPASAAASTFCPQLPDKHLEKVRSTYLGVAPYAIHENAPREHVPRPQQEVAQHFVLGGCQADITPTTPRPAESRLERDVGKAQHLGAFGGAGSQEPLAACGQQRDGGALRPQASQPASGSAGTQP